MVRVIILSLIFLFTGCDFWYDEICKSAHHCHINDFKRIYCRNNDKMMCNFNSKIEPVWKMLWQIPYDGLTCEEKGMNCNPGSDGHRWCTDVIEIGDFVEIPELGGYVYITKELYYDRRCCIPVELEE